MIDLSSRLEDLRTMIQSPEFLEGRGLSNEVNIRMFCYPPEDEPAIRHFTENLMADDELACHIVRFNLYHVLLGICDDMRINGKIPEQEKSKGSRFILSQLQRIANSTVIAGKMRYEPHNKGDVVIIDGVGEAFPFIRVHSLLDAIQPDFADLPVLVMYPGIFDGHYVTLFGKLKPNPYYRAFNII